jgi:hypothetical protein
MLNTPNLNGRLETAEVMYSGASGTHALIKIYSGTF